MHNIQSKTSANIRYIPILFVLFYIIASTMLFFYNKFFQEHGDIPSLKRLETYTQRHADEFQSGIFLSIFEQALQCSSDRDVLECQKRVASDLQRYIDVTQIETRSWLQTISDLIFVRKIQNKYYALHQSGMIEDITRSIDSLGQIQPTNFLSLITYHPCTQFHVYKNSNDHCEMVVELPMREPEAGYVVRLSAGNESETIEIFLFLPLLGFMGLWVNPRSVLTDSGQAPYAITFIVVIICTLCAYALISKRKK